MKRIAFFFTAICLVLAASCKGDINNAPGPDNGNTEEPDINTQVFLSIKMDPAFAEITMAVNADARKIPLTLSAYKLDGSNEAVEGVTVKKDVAVEIDPVGVVSCTLGEDGVFVSPKSVGTATVKIAPKSTMGSRLICKVVVTEKPAEPVSVAIVKVDDAFADGKLHLKEGDSFQLEAVVMNDKESVSLDFPVKWSVVSGSDYISVDENGLLTTKALDKGSVAASVLAEVDGYPSLTDILTVEIQSAPTGISLSGASVLNPDGEIILKVGKTATLTVGAEPAGAYNDFEVSTSRKAITCTYDGKTLTVKGVTSGPNAATVTIRSRHDSSVKKTVDVYVFQYEATDVKSGDYVYYASGTGGGFISTDCGLRYADGASSIYVDSQGKRSSTPQSHLSAWNSYFIGVVVTTDIPKDFDCSLLSECKDKANATGLYEYRSLKKTDLCGLSGNHALVLRKAQSSNMIEWQHNNEFIAICTDKKDGLYQSQLNQYLAFSNEDKKNGWRTESGGNTYNHYFDEYSECGLVPYLLLRFYTKHLNNSNFSVLPTTEIDAYTDAPKIGDGKGTTGWFLPGEKEWALIKEQVAIVNKSLSKSGAAQLSGIYWSTEECGEYNANGYKVSGNSVSSEKRYKDTRTHTNGDAYVRAVMYL